MKKYVYILTVLGILIGVPNSNAVEKENNADILINTPTFKDGQGYYSYNEPLDLMLPKDGRVLIQYFYQYGCELCLNADDYLKAYVGRNSDKVILKRSPSFLGGSEFTAKMDATFSAYGHKELSDKYLFDSADKKMRENLIEDNEAIKNWLIKNNVDIPKFYDLFSSSLIAQDVSKAKALYQSYYSPPRLPMAILNGKYILMSNTLYNDDYTYAVLDFLVDKLQEEKEK
ncbi:thiol:disulfide interchange protein DsbA/DsbL [Otariodibacter oris]|uniref:Thiol:disulfide interchange protein DsbA n=1 Tax=Otariodibacter oris TaxID=1032623 RepID=A0A420XFI4_9PAST|nr:thiol:disulfide interchange protein DsbA/DsbL [Otariodibacter oris]QGM79918.1 thiol disulfide oxidoreductase [Otariodibacter oris]RKR71276.1 thiol:disulfide interchange protein DsbA [Otariodibacter oris]